MTRQPLSDSVFDLTEFFMDRQEPAATASGDRNASGQRAPDRDFLCRARRVVESRLDCHSFSVVELAESLGLSCRQLRRRIRSESGQSPNAFIRSIRLERARSLIEDGCHTVSEVADAVQISSLSYFARCFREEFGVNPSDYGLQGGQIT